MVHVHMYQSITIYGKGCNARSMENASITPLVFLNMLRISSCTHDGGGPDYQEMSKGLRSYGHFCSKGHHLTIKIKGWGKTLALQMQGSSINNDSNNSNYFYYYYCCCYVFFCYYNLLKLLKLFQIPGFVTFEEENAHWSLSRFPVLLL